MDSLTMNLALVKAIKEYPCLYDNNLPTYTKKEITDKAWNEISNDIGIPGKNAYRLEWIFLGPLAILYYAHLISTVLIMLKSRYSNLVGMILYDTICRGVFWQTNDKHFIRYYKPYDLLFKTQIANIDF